MNTKFGKISDGNCGAPSSVTHVLSLRCLRSGAGASCDFHSHPFPEFTLVTDDSTVNGWALGKIGSAPNTLYLISAGRAARPLEFLNPAPAFLGHSLLGSAAGLFASSVRHRIQPGGSGNLPTNRRQHSAGYLLSCLTNTLIRWRSTRSLKSPGCNYCWSAWNDGWPGRITRSCCQSNRTAMCCNSGIWSTNASADPPNS